MSVFGKPGGFTDRNTGQFMEVGSARPPTRPGAGRAVHSAGDQRAAEGAGAERLPCILCGCGRRLAQQQLPDHADGREIVRFDPHFAVFSPSRYWLRPP